MRVRGVPDSFRTSTTDETKDGMDSDPEGKSPHYEQLPSRSSPNRRRSIPFALLGILTIGTGLAAFFAVREPTPSEALASALTNSLRFKTAAVAASIGVKGLGSTSMITSVGVINFDTEASTQDLRIVSGSQSLGEVIVSDGSKIFLHLDGGIIGKIAPGKSWVSLPSGVLGTERDGRRWARATMLQSCGCRARPAMRSPISAPRVNGQSVHLYAEHLTTTRINRDIAQEHLPQFVRQAIALFHIPAVTYTLAINGASQLSTGTATVRLHAGGRTDHGIRRCGLLALRHASEGVGASRSRGDSVPDVLSEGGGKGHAGRHLTGDAWSWGPSTRHRPARGTVGALLMGRTAVSSPAATSSSTAE